MVRVTVETLAQLVQGDVRGDARLTISGAASLEKSEPGDITFAADDKHFQKLVATKATVCIIGRHFESHEALVSIPTTLIFVADPLDAFIAVLKEFRPQRARPKIGISSAAFVSPKARIGPDCNIYPGAFIDDGVTIGARCDIHPGVTIGRDCIIGNDCTLHPHVVLYADVVLNDRVILHAGTVLGADGFGYRFRKGRFEKIPQLGSVHVENDCEIGACATIDRGMIGPTVIGEGSKLDNLVMIGHNCEIGRHNVFASQVGLAGSVTSGDYVRCAGQVGIADHVHLGEGCTLGAKSGVHKDIPAGEVQVGYPSRPEQEALRIAMSVNKVPEMRKQMRQLEAKLEKMSQQLEQLNRAEKAAA